MTAHCEASLVARQPLLMAGGDDFQGNNTIQQLLRSSPYHLFDVSDPRLAPVDSLKPHWYRVHFRHFVLPLSSHERE